jgi:hypothetical protein
MGDQSRAAFASQPAGQPEGEADQLAQNLTPDLAGLEDKIFRRLQGYYEAERQRMTSQIEQLQSDLQTVRQPLPAETNALPAAPPPEQQPEGSTPPDPVTAEAWRLMDQSGIDIDDNDPEYSMLDQSSSTAFLSSVRNAINAKRQRTTGLPQQMQQLASQAPTKTPTSAGMNGGKPTNTAEGLAARIADLSKNPSQNWREIDRLSTELRKYLG